MSGTRDGSGTVAASPRGRTILVTGGAGFIGTHLVASLTEHNDVRVLDDGSAGGLSSGQADATPIEADVRDADAVAEAAADVSGEAVNVGTGKSVTIAELALIGRDAVGADYDIVHVDPRQGDVRRSCADVSKAKTALGHTPSVSVEEGIDDLVARG